MHMQELPKQTGSQGDYLGPTSAPAPPVPPCTEVPWACPTIQNPYYNYFSKTRCITIIECLSVWTQGLSQAACSILPQK